MNRRSLLAAIGLSPLATLPVRAEPQTVSLHIDLNADTEPLRDEIRKEILRLKDANMGEVFLIDLYESQLRWTA